MSVSQQRHFTTKLGPDMRALIFVVLICLGFYSVCCNAEASSSFDMPQGGFAESSLMGEDEEEEETRILGGAAAENGKRPWMASILTKDADGNDLKTCAGTIISHTMILTAAQCLRKAATVKVLVGDVDNTLTADPAKLIDGNTWAMHPDFYYNILHNDIGYVNLSSSLAYSDFIMPLNLPKKSQVKKIDVFNGKKVTAHGWGGSSSTKTDKNCPVVAMRRKKRAAFDYVEMKVLNVSQCAQLLREVYYDMPKTISCADTSKGSTSVCGTDIGGPVTFMFPSDKMPTLIGVISHYEDCPTNYPDTYTFTGQYIDWLAKNGGPKERK